MYASVNNPSQSVEESEQAVTGTTATGMPRYVDAETTDRISDLLAEYSGKLRQASQDYEHRLSRGAFAGLAYFSFSALLFIALLSSVASGSWLNATNIGLWRVALWVVSAIAGGVIASWLLSLEYGKRRILRENLVTNANHLEKVVRVASQLEEHSERDMARRLELDLRLAEAETLLKYIGVQTGRKT